MKDHRMPLLALKRWKNDFPFSLVEGTDEGIDRPRFEEGLIAEGDENPFTSGIHDLKALMDGSAHSPLIIRIERDLYLFGRAFRPLLKPGFHSFVLLIEDHNDLPRFGSEERIETMFEDSLSSPGEEQLIHLHSLRLSRSEKNGGNHYSLPFSLKLR